mgnify:CR=1 FL=1
MNGISEEKYTHIDEIKEQTKAVFDELMEQAKLEEGDILVVRSQVIELAPIQVQRLEKLWHRRYLTAAEKKRFI